MQNDIFSQAIRKIESIELFKPIGNVAAINSGHIMISGLSKAAHIGDLVEIDTSNGAILSAEIIKIDADYVTVMPDGDLGGLQLGSRVLLRSERTIAPHESWLGRIIDSDGVPLDNMPLTTGWYDQPLKTSALAAADRRGFGARLPTGSFALNTVLPLVHGQRLGLFAGSGVGKSSLLGTLAQNVPCDVVVVALIGERGRELRHFTQNVLGPEGMKKCVVIASTSDKSALQRRRCAWSAMSVAEYFRDKGKSVLYLADSITRFAEAHREIASAAGELPVLQGHPASTAQLITELCERAGPGVDGAGDITAIFSVLVPGSDMEEPIADILRGVLDGHIILDRQIAERGRYPAINLLRSVSRSLPAAASPEENTIIAVVRQMISTYENNALMVRSGLYSEGSDPELDMAVKVWPELDKFFGKCGPNAPNECFDRLRLILRRSGVPY